MDTIMHEAQADSINVDDIAKNSNNRIVLRRLKSNKAIYPVINTNMVKMGKVALIIVQRVLMIWDGWVTLLVKINICIA